MKKKWEDDAESEPGQHGADVALAAGRDAPVETAPGTVHVATAVKLRGSGLQVQYRWAMAIAHCQLALSLVAHFFLVPLAHCSCDYYSIGSGVSSHLQDLGVLDNDF